MKKKLFTLLTLLLCLCSGAWGQETFTFTWTSAGTQGYCYSQSGPTGGKLISNNAIYFMSSASSAPAVQEISNNKYLNPQKIGFVFSPATDVKLSMNAAGNNTSRNLTVYVDKVYEQVYTAFADCAGTNTRMPAKILALCSTDTEKEWWKSHSNSKVIKISSNAYAAGTDGASIQCLSGEISPSASNYDLGTRETGTKSITWTAANTFNNFAIKLGDSESDYVFEAGKYYRLYVLANNNTGLAMNSFTFTSAASSHTITLDDNGEYQGNGSAKATEESATLTNITAPKRDGYSVEGYYDDAIYSNKVATAAGALQPSTAYTDANSKWTSTSDEVSLYAKWEAVELANTTGSKTWTFDDTNITSGSKTAASNSTEYVYSSISGMTFGANFDATALSFKGSYPYYSGGQNISQGSQWKFHPTVDGRVKASWYSANTDTRYLAINGSSAGSTNNTKVTSDAVAVSANADVVIAGYSDSNLETSAYIDVTEITFTATPYTLTYNSNGATNGSVPETAKKYAEGDEVTVLGNTGLLEKDGKTFAGWNTQADGLGTDYAADAVLTIGTADVTLYAKWASEYTVTHTLTNVTKTSGATTAYENTQYTAVFAAATNYDLPEAITVTAGGTNITASCTWTKATGTVVIPAAQVTGNIEITVTGVEHVAPTAGVIFSLTMNHTGSSVNITHGTSIDLGDYGTAINGSVKLGNQHASDDSKAQITNKNGGAFYFSGNAAYIKIELNDALKEGDVITFEKGDQTKQICFTTTDTYSNDYYTTSYTYACDAAFKDASTIYVWRKETSATDLHSLTITRNNSITLNNVSGAAYGFSTFCAPNNFTVTGATAYKASLDEGKLTLTALEGIIPANAGVILAADKGATASIAYTSSAATADMDGNALGGTTARTLTATLKGGNTYFYAFQNTTNTFKQYTGEYFPANKAYVVSNAQLSRGISMDFGETTGISNVDVNANDNFDVNAPMYNLAGQKVGKSYKGIVIVNGKKVVRK